MYAELVSYAPKGKKRRILLAQPSPLRKRDPHTRDNSMSLVSGSLFLSEGCILSGAKLRILLAEPSPHTREEGASSLRLLAAHRIITRGEGTHSPHTRKGQPKG